MAFTNQTSHFGLPQYIGSDRPKYLTDVNDAYKKIDDEIYNAQQKADTADASAELANANANSALTNANTAVEVANTANETAKTAEEKAVTAGNTADSAKAVAEQAETSAGNAVAIANNANTLAGEASGLATGAQSKADEAVKVGGNIANAYDVTKTYKVGDFCLYNGTFYKCITAVTKGEAFNVDKWDDVTVGEELLNLTGGESFDPTEINKTLATHTTQLDGLYFGQNSSGEYGYKTSATGSIIPFKKAASATGNAVASDVLSGKTFSNASGIGLTGTMVNNGAQSVSINPTDSGTVTKTLAGGYYSSISISASGKDAYDAGVASAGDLVVFHKGSADSGTSYVLDKDYHEIEVIAVNVTGSASALTYKGDGDIVMISSHSFTANSPFSIGNDLLGFFVKNAKEGDTFSITRADMTYLTITGTPVQS